MATVAKELFGPRFIRYGNRVSLNYLIANRVSTTESPLRVQPDEWRLRKMDNCFWTIVSDTSKIGLLDNDTIFGILTWKGIQQESVKRIEDVRSIHWCLYNSEQSTDDIFNKFSGIKPKQSKLKEIKADKS